MPANRANSAAELGRVTERVDDVLAEFTATRASQLGALHPELALLTDVLHPLLAGGKRLRPAFAYWGHRAAGGSDSAELLRALSALELVQIAALIHDDVIDGSANRRGQPAAQVAFAQSQLPAGTGVEVEQFGNGAAILLGDLCLSWADQLFYESGLPPAQLAAAKPFYDSMRTEVTAGQFLDLLVQARRSGSLADALAVTRLKTAKYTIERPLHIGAALAGADDELLAGLSAYGLPLGVAFQLRDDLLGVFGDPQVTGKPAGDDLREGKRTALIAIALHRVPADVRDKFEALIGDRKLSPADLEWLKAQLLSSGAADEVEALISQNVAAAMSALERLSIPSAASSALAGLATAATSRVK